MLDKEVLNQYVEQGHVKILWGELWHMDLLLKIGGITVDPMLLKASDRVLKTSPDPLTQQCHSPIGEYYKRSDTNSRRVYRGSTQPFGDAIYTDFWSQT